MSYSELTALRLSGLMLALLRAGRSRRSPNGPLCGLSKLIYLGLCRTDYLRHRLGQ